MAWLSMTQPPNQMTVIFKRLQVPLRPSTMNESPYHNVEAARGPEIQNEHDLFQLIQAYYNYCVFVCYRWEHSCWYTYFYTCHCVFGANFYLFHIITSNPSHRSVGKRCNTKVFLVHRLMEFLHFFYVSILLGI